jgi:hypothetical protein
MQMGFAKGVCPLWPIPDPFMITDKSATLVPRPPVPAILYQVC